MVIRLLAEPADALIDIPTTVEITGLDPGAVLEVRASMADHTGAEFSARAQFAADASGRILPAVQAPLAGSDYVGVQLMGLIWSMRSASPIGFQRTGVAPLALHVAAVRGDETLAHVEVVRRLVAPGVTRTVVEGGGLEGVLFEPRGDPEGVVIVVGGSGGGLDEAVPALLASHGFTSLALAYFAYKDLPAQLASIPLEYFETAFEWASQLGNGSERLGLIGASRGGELALLLGATYPQHLGAIIAHVPSHVVWGAVPPAQGPSWTLAGSPVPWFQPDGEPEAKAGPLKEPIATTPMFLAALRDEAAERRALIPVEQIDCDVLLISGTDDQMWPSTLMADRVEARLREQGFEHSCRHVRFEGAGHYIPTPFVPTVTPLIPHPQTGLVYALGGSAESTAQAAVDSWSVTLDFLRSSLS